MRQIRIPGDTFSDKGISLKRLAGFTADRLWILMLFYSIVPYSASSDVRGSLYNTLFISMCAMAGAVLFISVLIQKKDRIGTNRYIVICFATLMCIGSLCTAFTDPNTTNGMMFLCFGALFTGIGSAVLFMGWIELFYSIGSKRALVELSIATCASFVIGFLLIILPSAAAIIIIVCLPLISATFLLQGNRQMPPLEDAAEAPVQPKRLSKQTIGLFIKALGGAFLFGLLEGFFDVLSGYQAYVVQDIYGFYLFLGGFVSALVLCIIVVFHHRDSIFYAYRFAMLLFCLGCLLTPFMTDSNTYSSALIFGGYNCFLVLLCVVCIDVSASFRIGPTRVIGAGVLALYVGEIAGSSIGYALDIPGLHLDLASITLIAVSLLFVAHLFLFTETDLVRTGIGELGDDRNAKKASGSVPPATESAADGTLASALDTTAAVETENPSTLIVERFGLSQRESDVLPLLLQGRTISRIQSTLFISAGTVSTHIRHIYQKTGVNNRQELIDLMQEIIDAEETT